MELRDYLAIIGRRFWWFLLVVIVITLVSFIFTLRLPQSYDASSTMSVSKVQSQEVKDAEYQYDSYYSLQASSFYADGMMSLLKDPSNVKAIYDKANLEVPTLKLKSLAKLITTRKFQPASIQITLNQENEGAATTLLDKTISFINDYNQDSSINSEASKFTLNFSKPLIVKAEVSVLLNTIIGLILGIIFGLCLVFAVEYFKPSKK